jgi:hypothetical protein
LLVAFLLPTSPFLGDKRAGLLKDGGFGMKRFGEGEGAVHAGVNGSGYNLQEGSVLFYPSSSRRSLSLSTAKAGFRERRVA